VAPVAPVAPVAQPQPVAPQPWYKGLSVSTWVLMALGALVLAFVVFKGAQAIIGGGEHAGGGTTTEEHHGGGGDRELTPHPAARGSSS
jgi:hypothetical protein